MEASKTSIAALIIAILALILSVWPLISTTKGPAVSPDIFGYPVSRDISLEKQILELQCYVKSLRLGTFSERAVMMGPGACPELIRSTLHPALQRGD